MAQRTLEEARTEIMGRLAALGLLDIGYKQDLLNAKNLLQRIEIRRKIRHTSYIRDEYNALLRTIEREIAASTPPIMRDY